VRCCRRQQCFHSELACAIRIWYLYWIGGGNSRGSARHSDCSDCIDLSCAISATAPWCITTEATCGNSNGYVLCEMWTKNSDSYKSRPDELQSLEVDREAVVLGRLLGEGVAGQVFEGSATSLPSQSSDSSGRTKATQVSATRTRTVAVKLLRDSATHLDDSCALIDEARRMAALQHPNIVRLLAVCLRSKPMFLVVEHMPGGDLKSYLSKCAALADGQPGLMQSHLLHLAVDVTAGAQYLALRQSVHRDIAARNVLLDGNFTAKLGDFGIPIIPAASCITANTPSSSW
jgi:hypothetical protein